MTVAERGSFCAQLVRYSNNQYYIQNNKSLGLVMITSNFAECRASGSWSKENVVLHIGITERIKAAFCFNNVGPLKEKKRDLYVDISLIKTKLLAQIQRISRDISSTAVCRDSKYATKELTSHLSELSKLIKKLGTNNKQNLIRSLNRIHKELGNIEKKWEKIQSIIFYANYARITYAESAIIFAQ